MAAGVPNYTVRLMAENEIPDVLEIWKETGLSEGTYSVNTWFRYDPEGFFVAATDKGEILGVCAGILQNEDLAFIGMYAVKKTHQKRGIGIKIWKAVMDRVGDRNAGVNPVPDQLCNYRDRAGFPIQTTWNTNVYVSQVIYSERLTSRIEDYEVRHLQEEDIPNIESFDMTVYGFHRGNLIQLMSQEKDTVTVLAIHKTKRLICGYGNIKESIKGNALVGPLYANDQNIAEMILLQLIQKFPMATRCGLTLMVLDLNSEAVAMAEKLGLQKKCTISRLYRQQEVPFNHGKIFGEHNLNFAVF